MLKYLSLLFLSVTFVHSFLGQSKKDTIYFDKSWHTTARETASYYRLIDTIESGKKWRYKDFYFKSDKVQNEGYFYMLDPNLKTGMHTWYYQSGEIEIKGKYDKNRRIGQWDYFHQNGKLKKTGNYTEGRRSGTWQWFYENGKLESKATYNKGEFENTRNWYYPSGKIKRKGQFTDGKKNGEWVEFYETGEQKILENFDQNIRTGDRTSWYANGQLKFKEVYVSGILQDDAKYLDQDGQIVENAELLERLISYNLLWEISGNGLEKPSYLFGTMHVKDPRAFQFSDSLLLLFDKCEAFTMEIHPDSVFDYAYSEPQHAAIKHDYIAKTKEAKKDYSDDWYPWGKSNVFGARQSWERNKWVMNINQLFHRDGKVYQGMPYFLDAYLYTHARNQGKICVGQEDIQEHVDAGKNLPEYHQKFDILSQFNPAEEMISVYEQGNIERITAFSNFLSGEEFNYRMLVERNYKMATTIDSVVKLYSTFNTMGSAHLSGDEGVIEILRKKGYKLRPIKAANISEQSISKNENYQFNWNKISDNRYGFEIEFPRKPILFEKRYELTHMAPDLVNQSSYIAYGLDLSFEKSYEGKLTEDFIGKYFDRKLKKMSFLKVSQAGLKGYEVQYFKKIGQNKKVYYRYQIFLKDFTLYFVGLGTLEESRLQNSVAQKFFSSFKVNDFEKKDVQIAFKNIVDTVAAFKCDLPKNYKFEYINSQEKNSTRYAHYDEYENENKADMYIYHAYDSLTGNTFSTRFQKTDLKLAEDYFANLETTYNSYFGEYSSKESYTKGQIEYIDLTYKIHDFSVYIKAIFRNNRGYLAIAQMKKNDSELVNKFLNGFDIIPQKISRLNLVKFPIEGISVYLPSTDTINTKKYDHNLGLSDWQTKDMEEWEDVYNKKHKLFNHYTYKDSLNNTSYNLKCSHYSKYAYESDIPQYIYRTAINTYDIDGEYEIIDSSVSQNNGIDHFNYTFRNTTNNYYYKRSYFILDTMLYSLRIEYPEELKEQIPTEQFFTQYKVLGNTSSKFLSKNKIDLLVDSLISPKKIARAKARGALNYYELDDTNLKKIATKFSNLPKNTDSVFASTLAEEFINIMAESDNSLSVNYLLEWNQNQKDLSKSRELYILKSIGKHNPDTAIQLFVSNLASYDTIQDFPIYKCKQFFDLYLDDLEITQRNIKSIMKLRKYDFSKRYFYGIIENILEKDTDGEFDASFLADYSSELIEQLEKNLIRLDSLSADTTLIEKSLFEKLLNLDQYDGRSYVHTQRASYHNNGAFDTWVQYTQNDTVTYEEKEYYLATSSAYYTHLSEVQQMSEILKKINLSVPKKVIKMLQEFDDLQLKIEAFDFMVSQQLEIPDSLVLLVLNSKQGYSHLKELVDQEKTALIPASYKTQKQVTLLQLKDYFDKKYSFTIKSIKPLGTRKVKIADEKGLIHLYQIVYKYKKGNYIWAGGLQPLSDKEVNYDLDYVEVTRHYPGQDLEEVYLKILEEFKEQAEENWEEAYGI